jgi:hypothetical protein
MSNRIRQTFDFQKIRDSISAPGIDPRNFIAMGRIDEETEQDQDVFVWDEDFGWLVDVHLDNGEGPINCRMASFAQGGDVIKTSPPRPNTLVVVVFPNGDPNEDAIIIAQLTDVENKAPTEINGDTIVERNATEGSIAAIETHISSFPEEDLDQEWRNARITSENMTLGKADADQPYVRGEDIADALDDVFDAISDFAEALATATPAPPNGALTVADVAIAFIPLFAAIETFKTLRTTYLSTRINGD